LLGFIAVMHVAAFSDLLAALSRTAVPELPIPPDHTPGHEITVTPAGGKGNDEIPWRQQCDLGPPRSARCRHARQPQAGDIFVDLLQSREKRPPNHLT
jgi:hypothetical protein